MIRKTFAVGRLGCNCTILADEATKQAVVIDPGAEGARIAQLLADDELVVVAIVHTHAHIDHIGAAGELGRLTNAPAYLHPNDAFLHELLPQQAMMLGFPEPQQPCSNLRDLRDGMTLSFGAHELAVLHTPGHSPGSVCFAVSGGEICLSGDTLFAGGIGRTDLWGGDPHAIVHSIRTRLYDMHGDVEVIPGHGPLTTIDRERMSNPFVRGLRA